MENETKKIKFSEFFDKQIMTQPHKQNDFTENTSARKWHMNEMDGACMQRLIIKK